MFLWNPISTHWFQFHDAMTSSDDPPMIEAAEIESGDNVLEAGAGFGDAAGR